MPASLESPAGTAPSVLLIEEYDALAAAITSALKKFAPRHQTRTVESLSEADAAAAKMQPQLFVIDFDPPHAKAVEFLNRMRVAHPGARVLAIASGTSPALTAERYGANALQFIEKPFELAVFGAAVQALLGPWTEGRSGDSRGTLRDLNLRDLIPLECVSGTTVILAVEGTHKRAGEIHFLDGQICHATTAGLSGITALHEMLRWKDAHGREMERPPDSPRTIHGSWQSIFVEALRQTKPTGTELKAEEPAAAPVVPKAPVRRAKEGKTIVVIDDTEMLLIFVEDTLLIADPSLKIITAFSGNEGARRAEVMIPDLVLLDYSLPDLRGDQICQRLLQNKATARIPIVMMSGHVPEMLATAERFPNVVATIAKPFMSEALVGLVQETLRKGPAPLLASKQAQPAPVIEELPASSSTEARPGRSGNGRKPARKSGDPGTKAAEKQISPPAASPPPPSPTAPPVAVAPPAPPPPPPPAPARVTEIKEPLVTIPAPTAPVRPPAQETRPVAPPILAVPPATSPPPSPAKFATSNGSAVVLGLGMEVISIRVTPRLQLGSIRAKPSPATLSLTNPLNPSGENLWGVGFVLGPVELDSQGKIKTMRVMPTRQPAGSVHTHNGFAINSVALSPENAAIELTAGASASMTMQLVATFKVAGVELSDRFEVAQLILQPEGSRVRVTLDPLSRGTGGTEFETVRVTVDASGRLAEFVLGAAVA